jgi:GNAT superfamily N-acetyltransferase
MPELRPMHEDDVEAVHDLNVLTFEALDASRGRPPEPRPDPALAYIRYRHLVRHDPAGAWVAEHEGDIVGCALALRREDVWGLSLLVVRPDLQSSGTGGALLRRAHEYADGARGWIIMASPDPRALRAYFRLGLELHPSAAAVGTPRAVAPDGLREGDASDIPFTAAVDRQVRGAAHGPDIGVGLEMGHALLIVPERGYALVRPDGGVRLLAALDDAAAADLLRAALARADGEVTVDWLTAKQQWAFAVCVEAGLKLNAGAGAVFTSGDVGPFTPYLPSGAFL